MLTICSLQYMFYVILAIVLTPSLFLFLIVLFFSLIVSIPMRMVASVRLTLRNYLSRTLFFRKRNESA